MDTMWGTYITTGSSTSSQWSSAVYYDSDGTGTGTATARPQRTMPVSMTGIVDDIVEYAMKGKQLSLREIWEA